MSNFKVGDRVVYTNNNGSFFAEDYGTIESICYEQRRAAWWVKWDDGERLWCLESQMKLDETVEKFSLANTKINVVKHAEMWGIPIEQASKEIQEWLFANGVEYQHAGKRVMHTDKPSGVMYIDSSNHLLIGFVRQLEDNTFNKRTNKEITISRSVSYSAAYVEPAVEYVELNGKRYLKNDLEEALQKLTPVEE